MTVFGEPYIRLLMAIGAASAVILFSVTCNKIYESASDWLLARKIRRMRK